MATKLIGHNVLPITKRRRHAAIIICKWERLAYLLAYAHGAADLDEASLEMNVKAAVEYRVDSTVVVSS